MTAVEAVGTGTMRTPTDVATARDIWQDIRTWAMN